MGQYPGRIWFTHLKDMAKGSQSPAERANVVIGTGSIDIKGIVAAGAAAGVEIHYLEDESPARAHPGPAERGVLQVAL